MSYDLRIERLIDATPEEVYDALLDPDAQRKWYKLSDDWSVDIEKSDARVGGESTIIFGGDEKYREDLAYDTLDRPNRIVYTERMSRVKEGDGFETTVEMTLTPQDGKTLFVLEQKGFEAEERRDAHQQGWPEFLDRLEQVLAIR